MWLEVTQVGDDYGESKQEEQWLVNENSIQSIRLSDNEYVTDRDKERELYDIEYVNGKKDESVLIGERWVQNRDDLLDKLNRVKH
tara:strand:- start:372 stop:626 length:255 start_codon:yes stop_codon:yes gene_type:complete